MGQFSWLYSDNGKQMVDDKRVDSFLLVPEPFQAQYGKSIKEECYDGYGRMGGYDVYDLVADWNKESATVANMREPKREQWLPDEEGERYFQLAVIRFQHDCQRLADFKVKTDEEMKAIYGEDFKRMIGIDIACYDEQNAALQYPIKITSREMDYRYANPSESDPDQGWENEDDDYSWDEDFDDWDDEEF